MQEKQRQEMLVFVRLAGFSVWGAALLKLALTEVDTPPKNAKKQMELKDTQKKTLKYIKQLNVGDHICSNVMATFILAIYSQPVEKPNG